MSLLREHPSELDWSRWLAAELGWLAARSMRRHLSACGRCRRLEAEMAGERAAFDAAPDRRVELARLRASSALPPQRSPIPYLSRRGGVLAAGAAVASVAALALLQPEPAPRSELAAKGDSTLTFHVARAGGAAPLGPSCAPGARIMARYRTHQPFLLLLQRDGRGEVQVLFPLGGSASARLPGPAGATPHSFVLDATPGRECFAAFFSRRPLDALAAKGALAASPEAPALPGAEVRAQCCTKEVGR